MKVLAIIPARAGSKGVPGKNKKPLAGKPLILYSIEAAKGSKYVTDIVVNTDDEDIIKLAEKAGVNVLRRPDELATDKAPMVPVIMHSIEQMHAQQYDLMLLLQPTSPLRTSAHIDHAIELMQKHPQADGVLGVMRLFDHHPARIKKIGDDGYIADFCMPEEDAAGRTDLSPPAYIRNGAIYLTRMPYFLKHQTVKRGRMLPYEMTAEESINIDEPIDFLVAETICKKH
jgi:CMP-N,N'-diacetyllegionaminic acid synthase